MRSAFAILLLAVSVSAASGPTIVQKSPGVQPVVSIPPQPGIGIDRFRWFGIDGHQGAVTWEIEGDAAGFIEFATAAKVFGKTDTSGDDPVFSDVPAGSVVLWGKKPGDVKLSAWGVVDNRAKRLATIVLTVEGARPPPKPVPPIDVPAPKEGIYFLIVKPDGPSTPALLAAMELPAWKELEKAGHTYKPVSFSEAKTLGASIPNGTSLPAVLPLRIAADGKSSKEIPPPLPFPTTNDGVRKLMEVKP